MRWAQLANPGCQRPNVVEDVWFRTPVLKVRGKSFVRLGEDGKSVEIADEQEFLTATQPVLCYSTDHDRGYPAVLVRLSAPRVSEAWLRRERKWLLRALKTRAATRGVRVLAAPTPLVVTGRPRGGPPVRRYTRRRSEATGGGLSSRPRSVEGPGGDTYRVVQAAAASARSTPGAATLGNPPARAPVPPVRLRQ